MNNSSNSLALTMKDAAKLVGMSERSFRYYAKKYGLGQDEEEEPYDEPGLPVDEA